MKKQRAILHGGIIAAVALILISLLSPAASASGIRGDFDGNGTLTSADSVYLLRHVLLGDSYPVEQKGDVNGDGVLSSADAVYLLRSILMGSDAYPLSEDEEELEFPESDYGPIKSITLSFSGAYEEPIDWDQKTGTLVADVGDVFGVNDACSPSIYDSFVEFDFGDGSVIALKDSFFRFKRFIAVAPGTATVRFFYKNMTASLTVIVREPSAPEQPEDPKVSRVSILGAERVDAEGGTSVYSCEADVDGKYIDSIEWRVSDERVAAISQSGVLTPKKQGRVRITLTCDGVTAYKDVEVYYDFHENSYPIGQTPAELETAASLLGCTAESFIDAFMKTEEFYALEKTPENIGRARELIAELAPVWKNVAGNAGLLESVTDTALALISSDSVRLYRAAQTQSEWAHELTEKFDSYQSGSKIRQLAEDMGCDAVKAYRAFTMAQEILRGEAIDEEFFWETCEITARATKTSCKVGVALCGIAATAGLGAAAAPTVAATATAKTGLALGIQTGGMVVSGVDALLEVGKEGSKIVLGEDHEISMALDKTADSFSNVSLVFGLISYKAAEQADRVLFLADNFSSLFNEGKIGSINVDEATKTFFTKIMDSGSDIPEDKIEAMGIGNAVRQLTEVTAAEMKQKIDAAWDLFRVDDMIAALKIPDQERIKEEKLAELEEKWDEEYLMTDVGLLHRVEGTGSVYYVDENGVRSGPYTDYFEDGVTVKSTYYYRNGKKNGPFEEYKKDYNNGSAVYLYRKGSYLDDRFDGVLETLADTARQLTDGTVTTYTTRETYAAGVLNGPFVRFFGNGEKYAEGNYRNGVLTAKTLYHCLYTDQASAYTVGTPSEVYLYNPNGTTKQIDYYSGSGFRHSSSTNDENGNSVSYTRWSEKTGKIVYTRVSSVGEFDCVETYYSEDGVISEIISTRSDLSYYHQVYENGIIKEEGDCYASRVPRGVWRYYNPDGSLRSTYDYGYRS